MLKVKVFGLVARVNPWELSVEVNVVEEYSRRDSNFKVIGIKQNA